MNPLRFAMINAKAGLESDKSGYRCILKRLPVSSMDPKLRIANNLLQVNLKRRFSISGHPI